jgi:2-phosphosulfolactate phosphatase
MRIEVYDHVAGARSARGVAVVIDVFRAFATAAYACDGGATKVLPVAEIATALELRALEPKAVLVGERHTRRLAGFDAGNSPTEVLALDLRGRPVIHTTHAGTQGLLAAEAADEVLTGSFVNISAVCRYLLRRSPERVSLVRMGHEARERCLEDDLYAETLQRLLEGRDGRLGEVRATLRTAEAAQKFFDPAAEWAPETDFHYCTDVDRFGFVLRLRRSPDGPPQLERIDEPAGERSGAQHRS